MGKGSGGGVQFGGTIVIGSGVQLDGIGGIVGKAGNVGQPGGNGNGVPLVGGVSQADGNGNGVPFAGGVGQFVGHGHNGMVVEKGSEDIETPGGK